MPRLAVPLAAAAIVLAVAACGGPASAAPASSANAAPTASPVVATMPASAAGSGAAADTSTAPDASGGGASQGAGGTSSAPCAVLSNDEIKAIANVVVTSVSDDTNDSSSTCTYVLAQAGGIPVDGELTIEIDPRDGSSRYDTVASMFSMTNVSGVGDKAGWGPGDGLYAAKGDKMVIVQLLTPSAGTFAPKDATLKLMNAVLGKL